MAKTTSIAASKASLESLKDEALVLGFFQDKLSLENEIKNFDKANAQIVSSFIKDSGFKGEKGEIKSIYLGKNIKHVLLVGLGEENKYNLDAVSFVAADASKRLRNSGIRNFSLYLKSFSNGKIANSDLAEKIATSALMSLYKFSAYKTKDREKEDKKFVERITFLSDEPFEKEMMYAAYVAEAANKTRDLVNTPPNIATPEYVANYAKDLAKKNGLKCTVFDDKQISQMKMECFYAVGKGSINRPRFVVLEYNGGGKEKPIALVGKGVTFDSGGLNLKPYPFILNMKDDKGGAAALIHVAEACARLKLPANIVFITPLCENMIDADCYRPDDILTAYNGMTVEIKNTDAEGRLILADALAYAAKMNPKAIIDIATLTGASFIALGNLAAPFLTADENLREKINSASKKSLERVWELPLWEEYAEGIKSDVADIKNISEEGDAGVVIGAVFLKNFVNEVPWAHIDIGTTVWSKQDKGMFTKGATGATVRLMMEFLREWK